jgi:molybdopterin synthase catalytic subunit
MFSVSSKPIDIQKLKDTLSRPDAGALVTFEGMVRNHNEGRSVAALAYEACESLAISEADKIIEEAREKFEIYDAVCVHRVGDLAVGDVAVWVGVTSAHRKAAFIACQYIIDEIKTRLPIWKKETYCDGTSEWVNCQQCSTHDADKHKDSLVEAGERA